MTTPFPTTTPALLAGLSVYTAAVVTLLRAAFGEWVVVLAEHVQEIDGSLGVLVVDVPLVDVGESQMGPGLTAVMNLELVVATDRGKVDEGALDCLAMLDQVVRVVHENRFGLGDAVDPARFVGAERDPFGATTDNFYSWRAAFRQNVRLAYPDDLADNMALIIDEQRIYEVWLGIDPKIGIPHLPDYVLCGRVTDADYDAAQGGTP